MFSTNKGQMEQKKETAAVKFGDERNRRKAEEG